MKNNFVIVNTNIDIYTKNDIDYVNENMPLNCYISFIKTSNYFYENEYENENLIKYVIDTCKNNNITINGMCIGGIDIDLIPSKSKEMIKYEDEKITIAILDM
jgi:hypothetical protein